jgi:hypothetical protein
MKMTGPFGNTSIFSWAMSPVWILSHPFRLYSISYVSPILAHVFTITLSIPKHTGNTSPSLQNSRSDLVRRQREPKRTLISQLISVGVGSITLNISVIS